MNDKCCDDSQQEDCHAQGECCPPSSSSSTDGHSGGSGWKTAIFATVMLLVIGMMTYSVVTRETGAADTPAGQVSTIPTTPNAPSNAPITPGSGKLTLVENLNDAFTDDYDFVFVVLPGSDDDLNTEVSRYVTEAAARIQAQDAIPVGTFTLSRNDPKSTNPSVLISSKYGSKYLVTAGITETKLLQAYLGACSGSSSSCCPTSSPGSSSSCCP